MAVPRLSPAEVVAARRAQYRSKVLDAARAAVAGAADGGLTLWREAAGLFELVAGGVLDADEVTATLGDAARAAGMRPAKVADVLRRAKAKGESNPRRLPDDSPSGKGTLGAAPPVAAPVPVPDLSGPARDARAAVWATAERDPARWPGEVLAWCDAACVIPGEAAALGAGVLDAGRVRDLGEEVGDLAGFRSDDGRRWHRAVVAGAPVGLWIPATGPGEVVPSGWAWRPLRPLVIGENTVKTLRTRRVHGAGWWPFGWPGDAAEVVALVEGEKDWLALAAGAPAGWAVVGLPGAQWLPGWGDIIAGRRAVVVALDADEAGDECAAKVLDAARAAGVPAVRVHPPCGKDWVDALAAGIPRAAFVGLWQSAIDAIPDASLTHPAASGGRSLPRDVPGLYDAFLNALNRDPVTWPAELVEAVGGLDAVEDAAMMGAGIVGDECRALLSRVDADILTAAGFVSNGRPWGPVAAGAAPVLIVPLFTAASGPVGFVSGDGSTVGERWPVGLRWPGDMLLGRGASSRPVVLVRGVLDALAFGGLAFGLPGEDGVLSLDVVAVGERMRPEWADIIAGRAAVVVALPRESPALTAAVKAAKAAGVPVIGAGTKAKTWRDAALDIGRRAVVEHWRAKAREVLR